MVCWMTEAAALRPGGKLRHQAHHPRRPGPWSRTCTTGSTSTRCTATRAPTRSALNEIGRVSLRTTAPLFFDEYRRNRDDRQLHPHRRGHQRHRRRRHDPRPRLTHRGTHHARRRHQRRLAPPPTVAARRAPAGRAPPCGSPGCRARASRPSRSRSSACSSPRAAPPTCSTATTCATASTATSASAPHDRAENVRRVGEVARLFADAGVVALVPLISPYRADRDRGAGAPRRGRPPLRRGVRRHPASRCASSATRRASTPRPGPARSPASPASTTPTRRPSAPELVLRPEDGTPGQMAAAVIALLDAR